MNKIIKPLGIALIVGALTALVFSENKFDYDGRPITEQQFLSKKGNPRVHKKTYYGYDLGFISFALTFGISILAFNLHQKMKP